MDLTTFTEIFEKERYQLPLRWDGRDFYATLYKHLKAYREYIEKRGKDPDICADVKKICRGICAAVDCSLRGYPGKAYETFKGMGILKKDPLLIEKDDLLLVEKKDSSQAKKEDHNRALFRVVDVGNAAVPARKRVFHFPFNMRSKMSTQRYSIPGFPCLYLGTSLELCCMELEKDPKRDYLCAARYKLQTDRRINDPFGWSEKNQSPVFDNDRFVIFDVSIKPKKAVEKAQHNGDADIAELQTYSKWYPLIAACSYIRAMRNDPYSANISSRSFLSNGSLRV